MSIISEVGYKLLFRNFFISIFVKFLDDVVYFYYVSAFEYLCDFLTI